MKGQAGMQSGNVRRATPMLSRVRQVLDSPRGPRLVRRLSVVTTVGMFLVVLMGALVTNTGSGRGCGNSWPLCQGQFVPQFAVSTAIEYSHRAVTGVETVLVLLMTLGVLYYWRQRLEIKLLAPLMVLALFAQAALGAAAVLAKQTPAEVLALHFGVSLISFASLALTTLFIYEQGSWDALRDRAMPRGFRWLTWALLVYSYVVVYLGAYVRHRGVEMACAGWPTCNGQLFPGFVGSVGIVFTHRIAAFVLLVGSGALFLWGRRLRRARPDLSWGGLAVFGFVLLQALEGALLVATRMDLFARQAHSGVVALLFAALCYVALHTLRRPRGVRQYVRPQPARQSVAPTNPAEGIEVATRT